MDYLSMLLLSRRRSRKEWETSDPSKSKFYPHFKGRWLPINQLRKHRKTLRKLRPRRNECQCKFIL